MRRLVKFIYIAVVVATARSVAGAPSTTVVRVSPGLELDERCELRLSTARETSETGLRRARARWGSAYLAGFEELREVLLQSGVHSTRVRRFIRALDDLLGQDVVDASLQDLKTLFIQLADRRRLMICVLSAECSVSVSARATAAFSRDQRHAVVFLPFPTQYPEEFAVDILGAVSALAAERLFADWLEAISPRVEPGVFDAFAAHPRFELLFRTLYKMHQRLEMEISFGRVSTSKKRRAFVQRIYRELRSGPPGREMRRLMADLEITADNLHATAHHLIEDLRATVRRAR